ncbi:MAG: membrane protein insertase YidC [Acidobacteria bacterium]|nr:membrane protein insertase YidC [Acidobacteriota bacterium]MCZ6753428.1 membrane protein insertase YidC [Acidobacteriota bacterium]
MAKKELTPELRVLLAFGLSFLVLLLSRPLLVQPPPPGGGDAGGSDVSSGEAGEVAGGQETPESLAAPQAAAPALIGEAPEFPALQMAPTAGGTEQEITVETDLYQVVFSTRGAVVKSWKLKDYLDPEGNPLELVHTEAAAQAGEPFSLWVSERALRDEINTALFISSARGRLPVPGTLTFEYSSGRVAVRKQIIFSRDSYVVETETSLSRDGRAIGHGIAWPGAFGEMRTAGPGMGGIRVIYREPEGMVRLDPGDVEGEETVASGPFRFAGIEDHFFSAVFLPQQGPLRVTAFRHEIRLPGQDEMSPAIGVAVGSGASPENSMRLYVGPKATDVLAEVDALLPELVDYGWFGFIAKPLFMGLRWVHDNIVSNYGWSIVLLTIFINMLLFPLKLKSLRSMMKMQRLQPQIKAIQEKYKQYKFNDPRKKDMQSETMALYKKNGVNPLGGCLPMLLQLPFFIGFYRVLISSIEMRQAPWIWWIQDLSSPESFSIKVLPLLMCGTQFLLQKMSPATSPDPTQQKIMMFMPVMFLFFFWGLSSGLVLYWLTGNLMGIAQQVYINRIEMKHLIEAKRTASGKKKKALVGKVEK